MSTTFEVAAQKENILENIPRSYRKLWSTLTPLQKHEACIAIFTEQGGDSKQTQRDILGEISKHRGWSKGMQFKEIARGLSSTDKALACCEVAEAQRLSEKFYSTAIREWLLKHHIREIGTALDAAGIPNEQGMMNDFKGSVEVDKLAKLLTFHRDNPAVYSLVYIGYIIIDGLFTKNDLWKKIDKALALALGRREEPKPTEVAQELAQPAQKKSELFKRSQLSMYEQALVRSLAEGAISRSSNLKAIEAEQMVRQLIDASPSQARHSFLLGFAQALHGRAMDMIEVGATAERDRWHIAGYLLGLARDVALKEVYERLMSPAPLLDKLLGDERTSHHELIECGVTFGNMLAEADDHVRLSKLCKSLIANPLGIGNFIVADSALSLASKLTSEEKYDAALDLIDSAKQSVEYVLNPSESLNDLFLYVIEKAEYQRASVLLGLRKFKDAQAIFAKMIADPASRHRMGSRVWLSLSKGGVNRIEDIFPHGTKEKFDDIVRKLEAVSKEVSVGEASNHRLAQICNGLWLQSKGDHAGAIKAFDLAIAGMPDDSSYRRRKIQQWTQLCRAVSLVQNLNDDYRHDIKVAFQEAKEAGIKPSAWYLLDIAAPLGFFADPELIDIFGQLLPEGSLPDFNKAQWKSGAVKSDPRLQLTYLAWLESSNESGEAKWTQTAELLKSGWKQGGAAPEDALDFLSFLAFQDSKLAARLITLLDELGPSDCMLGQQEITTLKARLHASAGDVTQAVALLMPLFFNIANSTDAYLQQMALAIYDDIQEMRGDVTSLMPLRQKLVAQFEPDEELNPDVVRDAGEILLLYVGGNETQKRYEEDIRNDFAMKYPNVRIEYYCPGWSSNWNKAVDVIRPKLIEADGLLLSYYVRTMFGRTIRRACPDNCPWWGADGHGKASIIRGLTKAAQQAALRRSKKQ